MTALSGRACTGPAVQVVPSGEVRTLPVAPTSTNALPDQAMPVQPLPPSASRTQRTPSAEVSVASPTATYWFPFHTTLRSAALVPAAREVQVRPSGEVTMAPFPTATNCVPDQTTPFRSIPEIGAVASGVQLTP